MKLAVLKSLAAKTAEQAYLVSVLELWAEVEAQGIDPEIVQVFTFVDEFLTAAQKKQRERARFYQKPDPFTDGPKVLMFNALRLKDGSLRKLDPLLRAR